MNRLQRSMFTCVFATVLALLLTAPEAGAATLTCGAWSVVPSSNVGRSSNSLRGVAVVSASDVWSVGDYYDTVPDVYQTLIEHWNGTKWHVVPSPNFISRNNLLFGVAAVSASDVWAVGQYTTSVYQTLIEHWNGTTWSIVPSPNIGSNSYLYGVAVVSASDVWAVGYSSTSSSMQQTLIEHWNGTTWSVMPSPNVGSKSNFLLGVTRVPSSNNVWAVGDSRIYSRTLSEFFC